MTLRARIARWLSVRDGAGTLRPPGGRAGIVLDELDGRRLAVLSRGDALDVYQGRETIRVFGVSAATASKLAWFLFWTWWVRGTWCGLKLRVWAWAAYTPPPPPPKPALPAGAAAPAPPRDGQVRVATEPADPNFSPDRLARIIAHDLSRPKANGRP